MCREKHKDKGITKIRAHMRWFWMVSLISVMLSPECSTWSKHCHRNFSEWKNSLAK
jgi:hypothetical protein